MADGLLNLISACILAILGNVLDFRTYSAPNQGEDDLITAMQRNLMSKYDRNAIPSGERIAICYARGMALAMFGWIRSSCIIKTPKGAIIEDLPSRCIVQILNTVIAYKASAGQRQLKGAPHCDTKMLKAQIENVVKCDPLIEQCWKDRGEASKSLHFSLENGCTIHWKTDMPLSCKFFILFECRAEICCSSKLYSSWYDAF